MKKAVILSGTNQFLVTEGDVIEVELLSEPSKSLSFDPLLVINDGDTMVGKPFVEGVKVLAEVVSLNEAADKVTAIRYKAKKRVHKVHGHRQHHTVLKITQIK